VNDMIFIYFTNIFHKINKHIGKGLYYGSYKSPRVLLWSIGVIIFIVMMAFARP